METFSGLCSGMKDVGFVEKPKYEDGTSAWIGDEFEVQGDVYKILSVDYDTSGISVFGMNEKTNKATYIVNADSKKLKKPKDSIEKIMQEIEGYEGEKLKERIKGYVKRAHTCGFESALELTREKDGMM